MRNLLLIIFCTLTIGLTGQDSLLQVLHEQFENAEGIESIKAANKIFELQFKNGNYEEALDIAEEATQLSRELGYHNFIAIGLNRQARALIEMKDDEENQRDAIRKLRESQKILKKHKVRNPRLAANNKQMLKETAGFLGLKDDLVKAQKIFEETWDSVKVEIGEIENFPLIAEIAKEEHEKGEDYSNFGNPEKMQKARKRQNYINKILEMNKKQMEDEMKKAKVVAELSSKSYEIHPEPLIPTEIKIDPLEMQEAWVMEEDKIKKKLKQSEMKIEEMGMEEIKEELLFAEYKNQLDSLEYLRMEDSLNLAKQEIEIKRQESELARQKVQQSLSMVGGGGALLFSILILFGYFRQRKNNKLLSEKNTLIQEEQNRSEGLLLNILPAEVADELKQFGAAQAHKYENVSVLFSDFKNFSRIAEQLSPEQLVSELDYCFKAFDNIIEKYDLEKIKTIGDAYMCAGGLPTPNPENAKLAIEAAFEMQTFLKDWKAEKIANEEPFFEARIGIHTGPIVAGVVGVKKFAYDIWGDTVNIASRMESSGEVGKINISGTTFALVKEEFDCQHRGKIKAKNKGEIDMYFVHEPVVELS